jgi:hypothetical protein
MARTGDARGPAVRLGLLGLAALATALAAAPSSALEVTLSASRNTVSVGEQFTVQVEVRDDGMGSLPRPELPAVENLRAVSRYDSQGFQYVNGRATSSVTAQYVLIADAEGTFTIGPVDVKRGAEEATSNTVQVIVEPAGSTANAPRRLGADANEGSDSGGTDLIVLGRVDDDTPWVNQQITYSFTFLRRVRVLEGTRYERPQWTGFWAEELDVTQPEEVTFEGRRYIAERVRTALFPTRPGRFEIGPATLRATVEDRARSRARDPFDIFGNDPFGLLRTGREVVLRTDPTVVEVRQLPSEGKPQDFSGAVGKFRLDSKVDRTSVKAGEAVTLTITLAGEGNVKVVPAPDVSVLHEFKMYESSSNESAEVRGGKIHGTKTWEYVLVPTSGGDVPIPPVRLSVFDPEAGRYETIESQAIQLEVEASDLEDALARGDDPTVAKERVRLRQRDIRYVKAAPGSFRREQGGPFGTPAFLLAHAVPVLAFAGSALARRHKDRLRSDVRWARRRGAAKAAAVRLRTASAALGGAELAPFFGELSAALRGYVADRLHLAAANLDEAEVRRGLAEVGVVEEDLAALFAMLESCDSARFSPLGSDAVGARALLERAEKWIDAMERR